MNTNARKQLKAYISGKEWNSDDRSDSGNIFLNSKDFRNLEHFGVANNDLLELIFALVKVGLLEVVSGTGIDNSDVAYEVKCYVKIQSFLEA